MVRKAQNPDFTPEARDATYVWRGESGEGVSTSQPTGEV